MGVRVSVSREPVVEPLRGPLEGVTLTVRRLTTPDFSRCQQAVMSLLKDKGALAIILTRHELVTTAKDLKRAQTDPAFQAGYAVWLTSVECAMAGIVDWDGVSGDDGGKAPLVKDLTLAAGIAEPEDPHALAARITMETLMLDQVFEGQAMAAVNRSARLLAIEGNGSGLSANGSAAAAPKTTEGPTGASAARKPRKAARAADATG